jgi:hypothetical protein
MKIKYPGDIKIKYKAITKKSFTTSSYPIEFQVKINGVDCKGRWKPSRGYIVSQGVDINELKIGNQTVTLFKNGGTHKTYEIAADLKPALKQPKNIQFVGPTLSIDNLKDVFVNKIRQGLININVDGPTLTDEFLKAINFVNR